MLYYKYYEIFKKEGLIVNQDIEIFIDRYVKEIRNNNAAVFIGAGFSKSSGYVDWKNLLRDIAVELGLDINREDDLVSLAQYHYNQNQNRSIINDIIFEEFAQDKQVSENHKILARLPIFTYWTTNYDSLIEDSLQSIQKIVDVKYNNKHLSITKPSRDAIVYKMHGDKNNPDDTIIIKDDYQQYYHKYAPFITALNGDLISKTFLFIGFSFSDPNIDYILSRVRIEYGEGSRRQHYAIMRKPKLTDFKNEAEFDYAVRKHELFVDDLKRYNIKVLLINEYSQITQILMKIEHKINSNNIFISGSAHIYGDWPKEDAINLVHKLSQKLIQQDYNIISGFGLGIGSYVITGALEEIYMKKKSINEDRLLLRPFPQGIENEDTRNHLWTQYREDMISRAGISIFLFGNKFDSKSEEVKLANGMKAEFEIAKRHGNIIIPVGCTGFIAKEIWEDVNSDFLAFYPNCNPSLKDKFDKLMVKSNVDNLISSIIDFINELH